MPNSRLALSTHRATADTWVMLDLIGLPRSLGSWPVSSSFGTFRRGHFAHFVAARTEIRRVRNCYFGRGYRRLTQHITAASNRLDVVVTAGCSGKLFAERANQNINDFGLGLVSSPVKVVEDHTFWQDRSFPPAEEVEDAVFLRG